MKLYDLKFQFQIPGTFVVTYKLQISHHIEGLPKGQPIKRRTIRSIQCCSSDRESSRSKEKTSTESHQTKVTETPWSEPTEHTIPVENPFTKCVRDVSVENFQPKEDLTLYAASQLIWSPREKILLLGSYQIL